MASDRWMRIFRSIRFVWDASQGADTNLYTPILCVESSSIRSTTTLDVFSLKLPLLFSCSFSNTSLSASYTRHLYDPKTAALSKTHAHGPCFYRILTKKASCPHIIYSKLAVCRMLVLSYSTHIVQMIRQHKVSSLSK